MALNRLAIVFLSCLTVGACGHESAAPTVDRNGNERLPTVVAPAEFELQTAPVIEALRQEYSDRLAGLYIELSQRRIVVRLTGGEPVPSRTYGAGASRLLVVFASGAAQSFEALNRMLSARSAEISAKLPNAHARYVDERTGEIVIAVDEGTAVSQSVKDALASELGVPVRIVEQGRELAGPGPADMQ